MNFRQALRALEEGYRVRLRPCRSDNYIAFSLQGDDWEIYEEISYLNFQQVIKGLREGKKFRRLGWIGQKDLWIGLEQRKDSENCRIFECRLTSNQYEFTMFDFESADWIEVK